VTVPAKLALLDTHIRIRSKPFGRIVWIDRCVTPIA